MSRLELLSDAITRDLGALVLDYVQRPDKRALLAQLRRSVHDYEGEGVCILHDDDLPAHAVYDAYYGDRAKYGWIVNASRVSPAIDNLECASGD